MRQRGAGTIISISPMGGKIYTVLGAWYHASKHALKGWSDCFRLELRPFGINVVVIEPGLIETNFRDVVTQGLRKLSSGHYGKLSVSVQKSTTDAYGHGRAISPDVVADVLSRAIRRAKPEARNAVAKYAKPMIAIRKWFGDRVFDYAIPSPTKLFHAPELCRQVPNSARVLACAY